MLRIYNDGRRVTAVISGDIDHHTARELRAALDEVIAHSRPELMVIDLEGVGFMDSSGIGLLLGRLKNIRSVGGEILVKNAGESISAVIQLSGLSKILVKGVKT